MEEGIYIIEIDRDKLEFNVLKLQRGVSKVAEYLNNPDLRSKAEHLGSFKIPQHVDEWEGVEMTIYEMGFKIIEWHIGDKLDIVLASKS